MTILESIWKIPIKERTQSVQTPSPPPPPKKKKKNLRVEGIFFQSLTASRRGGLTLQSHQVPNITQRRPNMTQINKQTNETLPLPLISNLF